MNEELPSLTNDVLYFIDPFNPALRDPSPQSSIFKMVWREDDQSLVCTKKKNTLVKLAHHKIQRWGLVNPSHSTMCFRPCPLIAVVLPPKLQHKSGSKFIRILKGKEKAIIYRGSVVKQALLCGPSVMDWDVTSCQLIWCRGWVTSLWSASVSLAQTPSAQPFHIPAPSASIAVPPPHTTLPTPHPLPQPHLDH